MQAPREPGRQNIKVLFAVPAIARDCSVEVPIDSYDSTRNISPNPSMVFSNKTDTASGVPSRPVTPVPLVEC